MQGKYRIIELFIYIIIVIVAVIMLFVGQPKPLQTKPSTSSPTHSTQNPIEGSLPNVNLPYKQ